MEASAVSHLGGAPALAGRSPLLRLQSDEKLVALIRRGHHGAFEALVNRYNSRLLAFCRHMLGSTEDAEDVLQEVFTAAFNAICADDRPINARPWLYRIARNRCLNHLRRPQHAGQDSMDVFERDGGATTADTVHTREEFRQIVADVQELPESQRTALLLREIDALSYEQIAEAMDTTVPSVKSLLVRARVSLAEAAEARLLTCEEVRVELGQVAEGLMRTTPPVRRHLRTCDRCTVFRRELRNTNRALAAVYPIGFVVVLKKFLFAKLGAAAGGAASGGAAAAGGGAAAAGGGAAAGGAAAAGAGAMASGRRRLHLGRHRHGGHQGGRRHRGGGDRHGRRRGGQARGPSPGRAGGARAGGGPAGARAGGGLRGAAAHHRGARDAPRGPRRSRPPPRPPRARPPLPLRRSPPASPPAPPTRAAPPSRCRHSRSASRRAPPRPIPTGAGARALGHHRPGRPAAPPRSSRAHHGHERHDRRHRAEHDDDHHYSDHAAAALPTKAPPAEDAPPSSGG